MVRTITLIETGNVQFTASLKLLGEVRCYSGKNLSIMKKYLQLFMLVCLPILTLTGCSDEDDLPDVDILVDMEDVSVGPDNTIYIVQGGTFQINSITVKSLNGQNAALGSVEYYWDGPLYAVTNIAPFSIKFNTDNLPIGNHLFQIRTSVLQVDKSMAVAWLSYKVKVVASADDIPSESEPPANSKTTIRVELADK